MIPKIIHYCWFGNNEIPKKERECIESWKVYCGDYDIMEWNEENCDLESVRYVKEAYEAGKWAFVTDYIRLKVLTEYGGIYMDTDVEVIKPLDLFLNEHAFSGFQDENTVPTGIMACEKGFPLFCNLLDDYKTRSFKKSDGSYDFTTNVEVITRYCVEHGLVLNNQKQTIEGFTLYPKEFFCAKSFRTGRVECTDDTYTIHHFAGSWLTPWQKTKRSVKKILGPNNTEKLLALKHRNWSSCIL